jgi:uncharacterized spore protein YtfJ
MAMHTASPGSTQVPPRRTDDLLSALADRLGAQFATSTVFGEPTQRDDVTVIPVATLRFGFGGGGGRDPAKGQNGEGGGAGGTSTPVGYIEIKHGRSRFVPVVRPARMAALIGTMALAALVIVRSPIARGRHRRRPVLRR